jgi:hypothetical protein
MVGVAAFALVPVARVAASAQATRVPIEPDIFMRAYGSNVFAWSGVTRDPTTGMPKVRYPGRGPQWNYVTVALYGLQRWSDWRFDHGGTSARSQAVAAADFLIHSQGANGAWRYEFPFTYDDGVVDEVIRPGWISAQAQGNAISFLSYMYMATGDRPFLAAAVRALRPYTRAVGAGGIAFSLDGHTLLAGFPTPTPTLTLEDYEFALLGVADLAPYSAQAQHLLSALLPSFYWALTLYTSPRGRPYYDLVQNFVRGASGRVSEASARSCALVLRTLVAAYPSVHSARVMTVWTRSDDASGSRTSVARRRE